jgi:hypothetical protein
MLTLPNPVHRLLAGVPAARPPPTMLVTLAPGSVQVTSSASALAAAREHFATKHWLKLPAFLDAPVLEAVLKLIDAAPFYERVHPGIGTELCVEPGALTGTLEFLMNDASLFAAMRDLTGCAPIGCFDGRIYRMVPGTGHYDSWHSDVGKTRMVALSLNLGREPYVGGALEIRRSDTDAGAVSSVDNTTPGDAIIFRVDPDLRHRVMPLEGRVPRTAWAGWFCREPSYDELRTAHRAGVAGDPSAH